MTTAQSLSGALAGVVGDTIRDRGLTQRTVADQAGIPFTTLHRKLRGIAPFNVAELAVVADVLGTTLTDLALRAERAHDRSAA